MEDTSKTFTAEDWATLQSDYDAEVQEGGPLDVELTSDGGVSFECPRCYYFDLDVVNGNVFQYLEAEFSALDDGVQIAIIGFGGLLAVCTVWCTVWLCCRGGGDEKRRQTVAYAPVGVLQ